MSTRPGLTAILPPLALTGLALASAGVPAAAQPFQGASAETTGYHERVRHIRAVKDSLLLEEGSPIPQKERGSFAGLSYFPPQAGFLIEGDLHLYGRRRRLLTATNTDSLLPVVRYGRFVSEFAGEPFWLEIYHTEGTDELAVFFTDPTNGESTYDGGRYVPVYCGEGGRCVIDFNESYNPYCAYDGRAFICPMPPPRNRLPFPVTAGEKAYPKPPP